MKEKIKHYKGLLESSGVDDKEDFGFIPERIKSIMKELHKETKDDVFEAQNFSKIIEIAGVTYSKFLNNKAGTSFRLVFKIVHFFSLMGYNPMWIISRDNLLIPKKYGQSEFVMNKNTVDNAYNQLLQSIKASQEDTNLALDKFKEQITS
jgi:hypothetical protein|tara:strand:- start:49904 stop:50353 length:450 start_codon:yes stop_codon:yes gene_type:complete